MTLRLWGMAAAMLLTTIAAADTDYQKYSTEFLAPEGIWAVNLNFNHGSVSNEYDGEGKQRSLSERLAFNTSAFSTVGSLKLETNFVEITAGYGLTDDFSLGVRLPIGESCSRAELSVASTLVGLSPVFDPSSNDPVLQAPLLPIGTSPAGTVSPLTSEDLQTFLKEPVYGLAYSDADSHCESGLMGPVFGASWRVYNGEQDSLIFLPGVRLGRLTDKHDPDVLFQPIIDDGSTDLILRTDYYRDLRHNWDLIVQFEYNIQLEDKQTLRLSPLAPASTKERLKRDLGDFFIVDLELGYRFWRDQLRVYGAYYHKNKDGDNYRSSKGTDVSALERDTTFVDHEVRAGIYFDGVPAWKAGKLPLPLRLDLNYWESTSGKSALKYHFAEFHVTLAF